MRLQAAYVHGVHPGPFGPAAVNEREHDQLVEWRCLKGGHGACGSADTLVGVPKVRRSAPARGRLGYVVRQKSLSCSQSSVDFTRSLHLLGLISAPPHTADGVEGNEGCHTGWSAATVTVGDVACAICRLRSRYTPGI